MLSGKSSNPQSPAPDPQPLKKLLTIGGSDSGGAAGIQADLKTWAALGVYGMSAITMLTAQNSVAVQQVTPMTAEFVTAQLDAVLSDYGADGVKTGFVGRVDLLEAIAAIIPKYSTANFVVDPVLVNHKGEAMFAPEVTAVYQTHLFPLATLITPNRREAELLSGMEISDVAAAETAVAQIHNLGAQNILLKSIAHKDSLVDIFSDGTTITHLPMPKIRTNNTHGSGDTLSAAICAFLALGDDLPTAVSKAQTFTHNAIQQAVHLQLGVGHGPVWHQLPMQNGKLISDGP